MDSDRSKLKGVIWIAASVAVAFLFIVALPRAAKKVPWRLEKKISSYIAQSQEFQICKSVTGEATLQELVKRIYPLPGDADFPIHVQIIAGKTVNAFASLGGEIYVYDGLLQAAESPEELTGVLAHEIEHVHHRHIIQGVFVSLVTFELAAILIDPHSGVDPRLIQMLVNLKFSREQEGEADLDGLKRLQTAEVDTKGFANFFKREGNRSQIPTLLSDHPASEDRSALAEKFQSTAIRPVLSPEAWQRLKTICGK